MNKFRLLDCDISLQVKIWAKSQLNASNKSPGKKKKKAAQPKPNNSERKGMIKKTVT